ncbi:metalloregulator ArsR/SmtB family transcription factor (plasmid) [Ligilactobacillus salivarius]|uniref:Metalloregulator ArsR/SmtB family transcription factor n=2 Tax=Ligilactobacillus salivarius TaxID=1624 RepID=A0ABD7YYI2_9LACO|nr:metalloregulator ArsR/SmtB family transcription factor [Ligilactobacillus salivarius]WHS05102.1 metalloregulator ArsR/SmtB family transcription factor [Ligilactobacillus salivarius]WHS08989.1 metalloregulator ArsR/SmtB family transcription factor [Ligilactobacillus salivarius]WHS11211.1 metalloregulator ArsR/SmtB family transcription factor [Ligilactobacillus salivarius]WHS15171.1 metalloregulator ArsR/SmtB family transcription factor [Ligilactobacillus salivarius]WHS18595.1 metalloregulato
MTIELLQKDQERAKIFKALSEVKRIEIIRYLYQSKSVHSCGDIETSLNMSKSNRSYHLKILQEVNLINVERQGQFKIISINEQPFHEFLPGFLESL